LLPFLEASESIAGNGTKMDENVRAVVAADESETLGVIEPFDFPGYSFFRHKSLRS
jgi:hypothetical protein